MVGGGVTRCGVAAGMPAGAAAACSHVLGVAPRAGVPRGCALM